MKTFKLFFSIVLLTSSLSLMAQGRGQVLREIRDLTYQIERETYSTRADARDLTQVLTYLRRSLTTLQSRGGGGGRTFIECRDFSYPIFDRYLPSADAFDEATKICRNVEALPEMKWLYEKYDRTLMGSDALRKAARVSDFALVDKLELLEFAFDKYDRTLTADDAADRAVQRLRPMRPTRGPGGTLSCFQKTYPIYDRTLISDEAMDRTIQACQNQ